MICLEELWLDILNSPSNVRDVLFRHAGKLKLEVCDRQGNILYQRAPEQNGLLDMKGFISGAHLHCHRLLSWKSFTSLTFRCYVSIMSLSRQGFLICIFGYIFWTQASICCPSDLSFNAKKEDDNKKKHRYNNDNDNKLRCVKKVFSCSIILSQLLYL